MDIISEAHKFHGRDNIPLVKGKHNGKYNREGYKQAQMDDVRTYHQPRLYFFSRKYMCFSYPHCLLVLKSTLTAFSASAIACSGVLIAYKTQASYS